MTEQKRVIVMMCEEDVLNLSSVMDILYSIDTTGGGIHRDIRPEMLTLKGLIDSFNTNDLAEIPKGLLCGEGDDLSKYCRFVVDGGREERQYCTLFNGVELLSADKTGTLKCPACINICTTGFK